MRNRFKYSLAFIIVVTGLSSDAQYYYYDDNYYAGTFVAEAGIAGGLMNCLTDLGGRKGIGGPMWKDLDWRTNRPCASAYLLLHYKDAIGLRLEYCHGAVTAFDSLLKRSDPSLAGRYGRNLHFQSRIREWQLAFEIHPLLFSGSRARWSPCLVAGLAYYSFNPMAFLHGRWHELNPLRLEGQGFHEYPGLMPYRLKQFNIPVGIGLRYEIGPLLYGRLEIVHRMLFTDHLDDVSGNYIDPALFNKYLLPDQAAVARLLHARQRELQPGYAAPIGAPRGNAANNDSYLSIQLKLGYVFRQRRR